MKSLIRYGCVGVISTTTHVLTGWLLVDVFAIHALAGNSVAFLCSVAIAYIGNSKWSFSGHGQKTSISFFKYSITVAFGFIYNFVCVYSLVTLFKFEYMIALGFIIFSWPIFSFVLLKSWVFSDR